ncbi:MAG: hypothetical protein GY795_16130 [Desulfobacterales bacterium]|nr:hypothetical protein [Desulfobacterales bacterium]
MRRFPKTSVLGVAIRQPPTNVWHTGIISTEGSNLKWTNDAGYSWTLVADIENEQLLTTMICWIAPVTMILPL